MRIWGWFRPFLTREEKRSVAASLARAEKGTSGEIHVHLTSLSSPKGILDQAERLFFNLGLDKTVQRNGVLILIATSDRQFAIWGDQGIHQAAGQPLWDKARAALERKLRQGKTCEALEDCVAEVGQALSAHFPRRDDDVNELSDEVSEN